MPAWAKQPYKAKEPGTLVNLHTKQLNQLEDDRHIAHPGILKSCSIYRTDDITEVICHKIIKKIFINNNRRSL